VSDEQLLDYYRRRAPVYDEAYAGPAHAWVAGMVADLHGALRGRRVLEVACGTGHWTGGAADVAEHVVATDAAPEMLAIARRKLAGRPNVTVLQADAYELGALRVDVDALLAMTWLSHVPRGRLPGFLADVRDRVGSGGTVFFADNLGDDESYARDGTLDTFETRVLPDGSRHEIVKNYFERDELAALIEPTAAELEIVIGEYWWWTWYVTR
jgi:SAM-dependent methyltransferase